MTASDPTLPEAWRQHLAALPEVDPPESLWQRLQVDKSRSTRRVRWPWLAAAAMVAMAVLSWPRTEVPASLATGVELPAVDQSVRMLDQELALAYARRADEAELAALWQTRRRVLDATTQAEPPLVARL